MGVDEQILSRIDKFKADLSYMEVAQVVGKHVISGDSYLLDDDKHYALRAEIAKQFAIHTNEVVVVGSAKLGFSIAAEKRYLPFRDDSDIDIAIVSGPLFDQIWQQVFMYWDAGELWEQEQKFKEYLFRGWIRPDKLPRTRSFSLRKEWWEFFRQLTSRGTYGPFKIAAGLYKSWFFLERYQSICTKQCKQELEAQHANNSN